MLRWYTRRELELEQTWELLQTAYPAPHLAIELDPCLQIICDQGSLYRRLLVPVVLHQPWEL